MLYGIVQNIFNNPFKIFPISRYKNVIFYPDFSLILFQNQLILVQYPKAKFRQIDYFKIHFYKATVNRGDFQHLGNHLTQFFCFFLKTILSDGGEIVYSSGYPFFNQGLGHPQYKLLRGNTFTVNPRVAFIEGLNVAA